MKKFLLCFLCLFLLTSCGGKKEKAASGQETEEPESAVSTAFSVSVSQEYALSLLKNALPADCPFTVEELIFSEDYGVTLSGEADPDALCALYELTCPSFLPDRISFSTSAKVAFREGQIALTPVDIKVGFLKIPPEKLPAVLYSPLEEKLNAYLSSLPFSISDLQVKTGSLSVTGLKPSSGIFPLRRLFIQ